MFVHFNSLIYNSDEISYIDTKNYAKTCDIFVFFKDKEEPFAHVEGAEATSLIMKLCPEVLEGKQVKHHKHSWAIHNLVGHPLMQVCSWLHLTGLGLKIHDATVPDPKNY